MASMPDLPRVRPGASEAEVARVASEFEAMFIGQLLAPLFEGLSTQAPFGGGAGEDAFRPLLIAEYAKAFQARGGLGLADSVKAEMLRLQGLAPDMPGAAAPTDPETANAPARP
jgi:Rod binding domain-containing protein